MGQITPNISIYIPAAGETNYDSSFAAGMINIDQHDHSGPPNKGVPIASSGLAAGAVTYDKLNANVADNTTGIGTSGVLLNQLIILGLLKNIFQIATTTGFIAKNGSLATARTITGTANQIAVANGDGASGNPIISLSPTTLHSTQPSFLANADVQNGVTGMSAIYTVVFNLSAANNFQRGGSNFDGTSTFTAPATGVYLVHSDLSLAAITANNTLCEIQVLINNTNTYADFNGNIGAVRNSGNGFIVSVNQIMLLTAGDTVKIALQATGESSENINIIDGTFSAALLY